MADLSNMQGTSSAAQLAEDFKRRQQETTAAPLASMADAAQPATTSPGQALMASYQPQAAPIPVGSTQGLDVSAAGSGNDPLAALESNPNGAITAKTNPEAFNSSGNMIRDPQSSRIVSVTPGSVRKDAAGHVIQTIAPQANYAPPGSPMPPPKAPAPIVPATPKPSPEDVAKMRAQDAASASSQVPQTGGQRLAARFRPAGPPPPDEYEDLLKKHALQSSMVRALGEGAQRERDAATAEGDAERSRREAEIAKDSTERIAARDKINAHREELIKHEAGRDLEKEYFDKHGPIGHVANFLAAVSGGFLQGWNHMATNPGLDQINRNVDNYVRQQEAASSLKIKQADTMYSRFLEKTGDAAEAKALVHETVLENVKAKLVHAASETQDQAVRENNLAAAQQAELQLAQYRQARVAAADRAAANEASAPMRAMREGLDLEEKAAGIDLKRAEAARARGEGAAAGGSNKLEVTDLEGNPRVAKDPGAAEAFRKKAQGAREYLANLDDIIAIRAQHGGGTVSPSDRERAKLAGAAARIAYNPMHGIERQPSEGDIKLLEHIIPENGAELFSPSMDARLAAARQIAVRNMREADEQLLTPGQKLAADYKRRPQNQDVGIEPNR